MRLYKIALLALVATVSSGCLRFDVAHRLHPYGESDSGAYRISMNAFTYGLLEGDGSYAKLITRLRQFSRPTLRFDDQGAHVEDLSNSASIERMYDTFKCHESSTPNYVDCRFAANFDAKGVPNWSVDWAVIVPSHTSVVKSNHQRARTSGSERTLLWHFDATTDRGANIDFTVRTPKTAR